MRTTAARRSRAHVAAHRGPWDKDPRRKRRFVADPTFRRLWVTGHHTERHGTLPGMVAERQSGLLTRMRPGDTEHDAVCPGEQSPPPVSGLHGPPVVR